jgi:hypothetical protein
MMAAPDEDNDDGNDDDNDDNDVGSTNACRRLNNSCRTDVDAVAVTAKTL